MLVFVTVNAQSNPPAPGSGNPNAKPESRTDNNGKNSDNTKRAAKVLPAVIEISKAPVIQIEAADKNQKRSWTSSPDWWMVGFTGILALITATLAFYTGMLYRATVKLGTDAEKNSRIQFDKMERSLAIAEQSASASSESARAGIKTANIMKYTAEQELRAYVFMKINAENVSVWPDWYQSMPIIFQNFGKTPAHDVIISMHSKALKYPLETEIPYKPLDARASKSVIPPGDQVYSHVILNVGLTQAEITDITAGHYAIYLIGTIVYSDAFTNRHTTYVCLYSNGAAFSKHLFARYHEGNYEKEG